MLDPRDTCRLHLATPAAMHLQLSRSARHDGCVLHRGPTVNQNAGYSHPDAPVRHSYPLAIEQPDLSTAFSLVMRTAPYALARFGILFASSLATVLWWVIAVGGAS